MIIVNNYINIYEIDKEGKELKKLKIDTYSVVVKDERTSKFSLWDPYVDIGFGLGIAAKSSLKDLKLKGIASLGISASSYGLSGNEPLWRFGKASINLSDQVSVGLSPFVYNIGKNLPLLDNLWIGPFADYGLSNKDIGFGINLGANL